MGNNHRTEKIAVLTDTGSSISPQQGKEMGIWVLPLQIIEGLNSYSDLVEINTNQIYDKLNQQIELKTSMPAYSVIVEALIEIKEQGYQKVICVPLTPGISSTRDNIEIAAKETGIPVVFIDTYTTCQIQKTVVLEVKDMIEHGLDCDEIILLVESQIETSSSFVLAGNIQHLKRGGRLTPLAASVANMLKIVPLLMMNKSTKGKIDVFAKVRTERKAKKEIVQQALQLMDNECYEVVVLHSDDRNGANELKEMLKEAGVAEERIRIEEFNSVIAVHVGMKCLALQCMERIES